MMIKISHSPIVLLTAVLFIMSSCSKNDTQSIGRVGNGTPDGPVPPGSIVTDILYGNNTNWLNQNEQLMLDVYVPPGNPRKHPLILFIHGGGFEVGDKSTAEDFASQMQQKGFVVAPINYRIGWTHSETDFCDGDSTEAIEAFYRAIQDTRAALRYLVANADIYSIDTNWIFVGGASAGGVATLGVTYYNQQTIDKYMPGISAKLGPLDADNNITANFKIKADINMWGAISTIDVITQSNAVPTIFFHGEKDMVVPYDTDNFYFCSNMPMAYGSKPLYDKLTSLGVPAVAHIDPNGGHGVYTIPFRADNTACFLNSLMNKQPETGFYIGDKSSCP
jgi:acetyl esterase/lipase